MQVQIIAPRTALGTNSRREVAATRTIWETSETKRESTEKQGIRVSPTIVEHRYLHLES
jgi:hypothetical protein